MNKEIRSKSARMRHEAKIEHNEEIQNEKLTDFKWIIDELYEKYDIESIEEKEDKMYVKIRNERDLKEEG